MSYAAKGSCYIVCRGLSMLSSIGVLRKLQHINWSISYLSHPGREGGGGGGGGGGSTLLLYTPTYLAAKHAY